MCIDVREAPAMKRRIVGVAGIGLLAIGLAACGERAPVAPDAPRPVMTVDVVSPQQQSWPEDVVVSGEIAAWDEAIVGVELGGLRLQQVLVNVGDRVTQGQLLAKLNDDSLQADLARLEASVLVASANLAKAKADAARADKLEASSVLSAQSIQAYRTQAQVAEAEWTAARADRDAQAIKLRNARIVAPDDGVISSRTATVGSVSTPGAELFRLLRQSRIEWRAEVPESLFPRLKAGDSAVLEALDGAPVAGSLRELSPTLDPATRNGIGYVDLPAGAGLVPGMYVSGRFRLPERSAITLPESAIVLRDGNRYLMRIDGDSRIHQVKVRTGRRQGKAIEIIDDAGDAVGAADRFVAAGGAFVNDGDLVRVETASEAARP